MCQLPCLRSILAAALVVGVASAQSTTWTGFASADWFTAANWSRGVPTGTTSAIIGTRGFRPIVSGGGAECLDLQVLGSLTIDALRILTVHGSADLQATVLGDGTLGFVGSGAAGSVTMGAGVSVGALRLAMARDLTLRDVSVRNDLAFSGAGRLLWEGEVAVGRNLILTGQEVVMLGGGVNITVGNDATLGTVATMTAPFTRLSVANDLTAATTFRPLSGEVVFTGPTMHAVGSASGEWASIRVAAGSLVLPDGSVLHGSLVAEAGATLRIGALTLRPLGPVELRSAATIAAGTLDVPGASMHRVTIAGIDFQSAVVRTAGLAIVGRVEFGFLRVTDGSALLGSASDTPAGTAPASGSTRRTPRGGWRSARSSRSRRPRSTASTRRWSSPGARCVRRSESPRGRR
ncbi:MAG: hypothetical protein IPM13_18035 [Phycisphaerales bacterium]|nr:hypothetical protein [Phycisphaerales bacterium]